ncbi:MAG: GyrI-like domain-containing protein [Deltaproteobacteria bacterium]|jgi:predicted transcriptional regulator YdeE|nr:GyrI-like domain-containing protein [Deltaproteobacteria bacterium]
MSKRARETTVGDLDHQSDDQLTSAQARSLLIAPTSSEPVERVLANETKWALNREIRVDAIETLPHKTLVGYCAIVSPENVKSLYEKIWRVFLKRMENMAGFEERAYYGVCCNLQANRFFEYWLTVEAQPGDQIPKDLIPFHLSSGTYGSSVKALDFSLPNIYHSLIHQWTAPADYALDWKLPFYEIHVPGRQRRDAIKICLPLQFAVMNYKQYLSVCLGA